MSTNPKERVGLTKPPLRLVPPALAIHVAVAMADGAVKYGPFNWRENPVSLNTYLEGIERHLLAMKDRENLTRDSKVHHVAAIGAGCAIILDAFELGNLVDDRPIAGPAADIIARFTKAAVAEPTEEDTPIPYTLSEVPSWIQEPAKSSPYRERKKAR